MRSVERRFLNIQKENPNFSSYICFAKAIRGQNFSNKIVREWFNKLVDEDDYAKAEKWEILKNLFNLKTD